MMARSTTRSNQRPDTLMQDRICQVDETSCNARPDHTFGSNASIWPRFGHVWSCPYSRHGDQRFGLVATGPEAAIEPDLRLALAKPRFSLVAIHVIQHA